MSPRFSFHHQQISTFKSQHPDCHLLLVQGRDPASYLHLRSDPPNVAGRRSNDMLSSQYWSDPVKGGGEGRDGMWACMFGPKRNPWENENMLVVWSWGRFLNLFGQDGWKTNFRKKVFPEKYGSCLDRIISLDKKIMVHIPSTSFKDAIIPCSSQHLQALLLDLPMTRQAATSPGESNPYRAARGMWLWFQKAADSNKKSQGWTGFMVNVPFGIN